MSNEQMDAQVMAIVNAAGAVRRMEQKTPRQGRRTKAKMPCEAKAIAMIVVSLALASAGFACLLCQAFLAEIVLMMLSLMLYGAALNLGES
jgi:hypothetical protein